MKKTHLPVLAALLFAATLIAFSPVYRSSPVAAKAGMIADWERAKAYTLEYLSAASDEVITFKPTAEMRTFGQQMLHLSEANYGLGSAASGKTSPVAFGQLEKASDKYKTKEALTQVVMESYDFVICFECNEMHFHPPEGESSYHSFGAGLGPEPLAGML